MVTRIYRSTDRTEPVSCEFRLIWGPGLVIFASHHVVSCRISPGEAFVAICLRHGPTEKLGIYLKNCRDKLVRGKVVIAASGGNHSGVSGAHVPVSVLLGDAGGACYVKGLHLNQGEGPRAISVCVGAPKPSIKEKDLLLFDLFVCVSVQRPKKEREPSHPPPKGKRGRLLRAATGGSQI